MGLIVNEPKSYESKKYSLINSVLTHQTSGEVIPYYSLSLAKDHNVKGGSQRLLFQADAIDKRLNLIVDYSLYLAKKQRREFLKTLDPFFELIQRRLRIESFRLNWFLEKDLGGLGLSNITNCKYKVSLAQQRLANYLVLHPDKRLFIDRIDSKVRAVDSAVQLFNIIKPKLVPLVSYEGLPIYGPYREGNDPEQVQDVYLRRCLEDSKLLRQPYVSLKDYLLGAGPEYRLKTLRQKKWLKIPKEDLEDLSTLRKFTGVRWMIWHPDLAF